MGPVGTGGPRTADESSNLDNMPIGVLGRDQQLVKYSNPCLLGYLFPTLYPEGRGFFSKDYDGINNGQSQRIQCHDDNIDNHVVVQNDDNEEDIEVQVSQSDSDSEENEMEIDMGGRGESKYSKHTIKSYTKYRLLSADRRWGRNIKFILMMFDWIQKNAIFGYQMRIASATTGGRATRAHDILERSNDGSRTKYRESSTVAIPPIIRTGAKYKSMLYQKFSAVFNEFGTPQLFGTFSCDDRSAGQLAVAEHFGGPGTKTHDDPVLFTMHWKRQWLRFWSWVVTSRKGHEGWATRRVGGLRAWCWVFELQDRGTPHTHFCLWTNNSIEEMIDDGVISSSKSQEKEEDRALILKHQIHKCTAYCKPDPSDPCRFKYPRPPSSRRTYLGEDGRYVLQREEGDEYVNGYNMELLRFGRVNMDLQYNQGDKAKNYMCKN
ncbi:hypothetical protein BGZ81_005791 [Podila clonocystis]|nr:hypothetical protein BGZ81_005791 [Podila clonocystis]